MDKRVTEFPIAEAKARFSELVDRAGNGESITIKRHGKPVAKLVPLTRLPLTVEERRKSTEDWIAYRKAHNITLGPGLTTKDLINEGRKYFGHVIEVAYQNATDTKRSIRGANCVRLRPDKAVRA